MSFSLPLLYSHPTLFLPLLPPAPFSAPSSAFVLRRATDRCDAGRGRRRGRRQKQVGRSLSLSRGPGRTSREAASDEARMTWRFLRTKA